MAGTVQDGAQAGGLPTGCATPRSRSILPSGLCSLNLSTCSLNIAHLSLLHSGRSIDIAPSLTTCPNTGPEQVSLSVSQVRKRRRLVLTTLHHRRRYEASHLTISTSSASPPMAPYRPFTLRNLIVGLDAFKTSARGLSVVSLDPLLV